MSTFRPPPGDRAPASKLSMDPESNPSLEPHRQGAFKPSTGGVDDIAPISSRYDRLPVSQRSSSLSATMNAVTRPPTPAASGFAAAPVRASKGGIYQVTKMLEKKHGAFFISRLILASGISLRGYDSASFDDPEIVSKFIKTLRTMLSPADMADVFSQAPSLMNMK